MHCAISTYSSFTFFIIDYWQQLLVDEKTVDDVDYQVVKHRSIKVPVVEPLKSVLGAPFIGASAGPRTFSRCPYPRGGYNSCLTWCNSMAENYSAMARCSEENLRHVTSFPLDQVESVL